MMNPVVYHSKNCYTLNGTWIRRTKCL